MCPTLWHAVLRMKLGDTVMPRDGLTCIEGTREKGGGGEGLEEE